MPEIDSPHVWYPGVYPTTSYDLRHVLAWHPKPTDATVVQVRFVSDLANVIEFDLAAFEVAKQNSLDNGG